MKKLLKKYSSLILLCLIAIPAGSFPRMPLQITKRHIVKTYTDLKKERLIINNQYGDVLVKTWQQQKIVVVIMLTAHAKTTTAANKLLDRINITAERNQSEISVNTQITKLVKLLPAGIILQKKSPVADTSSNEKPLPKDGCCIDYEVFLPAGTSLNVLNKFGNITIGDYNAALYLENKFGNIKGGSLTGRSTLKIEQGDLELKYISRANLKAKAFGTIKIGSTEGEVSGAFSSGNLLDIGLSNRDDSIIIDADNVRKINIAGIAATNANYSIKTILSKLLNKSTLELKELTNIERKPQSKLGVDSLATLLKNKTNQQGSSEKDIEMQKKKLQITLISQLKKLREYESTAGNGKGRISFKVAFSALTILN